MNGTTLAGALTSVLLLAPLASAQTSNDRSTALFPFVPGEPDHLTISQEYLGWLDGRDHLVMVENQVPGAPDATFLLDRVRLVDDQGGLLRVDGEVVGPIADFRSADLQCWKGRVDGQLASDVFLTFSSAGTWGWVRFEDGRTVHLQCGPHPEFGWERTQARWIEDAALRRPGFESRFLCGTAKPTAADFSPEEYRPRDTGNGSQRDEHDHTGDGAVGGAGGGATVPFAPAAQWTEYTAEAVIETDYAYYQEFNNQTVATNYATQLVSACSARYEEQIGCLWDLASLSIHTSNGSDPYSGTNPDALLNEIDNFWDGPSGLHNLGDFGLVLSGHNGGGVAFLNVLCSNTKAVGSCCSINGNANFPVNGQSSANWDFVVTTHEAGHIFNALHTHDFCPPLDHCDTNCDGFTNCPVGTIMSYCHTCSFQGVQHITPFFHQSNINRMRSKVENVNCLDIYVPPPSQPIITSVSPTTIPALTLDNWPVITVTGQNFSSVTAVQIDGVALSGFPPQYTVVNDSTITIKSFPFSKLGPIFIRIQNPSGLASTSIDVTPVTAPLIDMVPSDPAFWVQATGLKCYYACDPNTWLYLIASPSNVPTVIPGIVTLDIGNNLLAAALLGFFAIDPVKGWGVFSTPVPSNTHFATGTILRMQAVVYPVLAPTVPFDVTNVQKITVVF